MNRYCPYCKKETPHTCTGKGEGTNTGNATYVCHKCGSTNDTIQGFAANLM